jgi:hypothetical protein
MLAVVPVDNANANAKWFWYSIFAAGGGGVVCY